MPVIGDPPPTRPPGEGVGSGHGGSDGALERLARLARRLFNVDTAIVARADAAGACEAMAGTPPASPQPWSMQSPIRAADGRLLGSVRLLHGEARAFTDEDSQTLQDLADLAATAIAPPHRASAPTKSPGGRKPGSCRWPSPVAARGSGTATW